MKTITDLFVPFELAVKLKEKGFDKPCLGFYNYKKSFAFMTIGINNSDAKECLPDGCITAPLYQQVIDWFREKHKLHFYIDTTPTFDKMQGSKYKVSIKTPFQPFKWTTGYYYLGNTYYEALDKAIIEALKLI